jgi:chromosome segregation ATPase
MTTTTQRLEIVSAQLKALLQQEIALKQQIANVRQELLNTAIAHNSEHKTITTASGTVTVAEIHVKTYSAKVAKLSDKVDEWKAKMAAQKMIEERLGTVILSDPTLQLRFKAI